MQKKLADGKPPVFLLMISGNLNRKSVFVDLIKKDQLGLSIMMKAAPGNVYYRFVMGKKIAMDPA